MTYRALLKRFAAALVLPLLLADLAAPAPATAQEPGPTVFAAASLKNALDAVSAAFERETGAKAIISYAASSALAKQIEQGAPADIFISADRDWMDYLAEREKIVPATRVDLLGNQLVLIAPAGSAEKITLEEGFDLAGLLDGGRLAVANTESVPAGKYAKAALTSLKLWDGVKDRLAQAQDVRGALALVARGEAPLGIVYRTDANAETKVRIVGVFPAGSHPEIVYPAAAVAGQADKAAGFLRFLRSSAAGKLFEAQGFTLIGKP